MRLNFALAFLSLFAFSCATSTKTEKPTYSPKLSYALDDQLFEATMMLPKKFEGKLPLVVIVHEWWGRNEFMSEQSKRLTDAGYATLAVDLFGNNQVVETPAEAQALATPFYQNPQMGIERLTKFIELAKNDPHVDASKIYVIGFCFGGTQALNLARTGMDLAGVVSFHGGLASSLPQMPIKARVLALNGLADPMVPAKERAAFEKEMKAIKANYKSINYKGATHAFTNPKATEIGKKYKIPVAYSKTAAEASYKELFKFLKQ